MPVTLYAPEVYSLQEAFGDVMIKPGNAAMVAEAGTFVQLNMTG